MNTQTSNQTQTRFILFSLAFLALFAALAAFMPDLALASDDFGMGGPFETVKNVITGKWGKMISIAGMACCGIVFICRQQLGQHRTIRKARTELSV